MRKFLVFMTAVICQMLAMGAAAQGLTGKWVMGDVASDLEDGVVMHISGVYDFKADGAAKAKYRIVVTMTRPDDPDAKSVYMEMRIDGDGKYDMADGNLDVDLEKADKDFRFGEGTYEDMGPAYKDSDPEGEKFLRIFFTALTDLAADGFRDITIKDVSKSGCVMHGTLMGSPVTLTTTECVSAL